MINFRARLDELYSSVTLKVMPVRLTSDQAAWTRCGQFHRERSLVRNAKSGTYWWKKSERFSLWEFVLSVDIINAARKRIANSQSLPAIVSSEQARIEAATTN
jgi:hypothetical protein